ncbi:Uncharacterized protein FKW44_005745, partial [Caligus rogercresseyi]
LWIIHGLDWNARIGFSHSPERKEIWIPREEWHVFSPMLLAEGLFGAGMISSYLKIIQIFSINPYLGPLQVSLGKMIIDIAKWLVLYILVLFSFGCGLNQLLWYYSDLERQKCYSLPNGLPDFEVFVHGIYSVPKLPLLAALSMRAFKERWRESLSFSNNGELPQNSALYILYHFITYFLMNSCVTWRRFANLWETSQSLFWASFGLVELGDFELTGLKEFTRFWGLLMFGSYSVCNIIVLLNMLIAMMSNSYTAIAERSDTEWKFARSRLWISYFDKGSTVPPPFNIVPTPKSFMKLFTLTYCKQSDKQKVDSKTRKAADNRYYGVVRCLVKRYITEEQRKSQDFNVTEDDINEVRQDIRSFRYDLINILKQNNMKTPNEKEKSVIGRKSKDLERMIAKGFNISKVEGVMSNMFESVVSTSKPKDLFQKLARAAAKKTSKREKKKLESQPASFDASNPIGSKAASIKRKTASLRKSLIRRDKTLMDMKTDSLLVYNPLLKDVSPATRIAYAKFKGGLDDILYEKDEETSRPASPVKETKVETVNETTKVASDAVVPKEATELTAAVSKGTTEVQADVQSQPKDKAEPPAAASPVKKVKEGPKASPVKEVEASKGVSPADGKGSKEATPSSVAGSEEICKTVEDEAAKKGDVPAQGASLPPPTPVKTPKKSPKKSSQTEGALMGIEPIVKKDMNLDEFLEADEDEEEGDGNKDSDSASFKAKGKSVLTGKPITGGFNGISYLI